MKTLKFIDNNEEIELNNIYCIGQNYAKHIKEMGAKYPSEPTIFLKPNSAYIESGENIIIPKISNNVHHELELVVLIGKDAKDIDMHNVWQYILGYAVGIDATLRDVQSVAKSEGKPWAVSKGFYSSAPISKFVNQSNFGENIPNFKFDLKINGELRQEGNSSEMERNIPQLIKYIADVFTIKRGDVIFTGTPSGVSQIHRGDKLEAKLAEYVDLHIGVVWWRVP